MLKIKYLLIGLFVILVTSPVSSQELKVKSFICDENDMSARMMEYQRLDKNGEACALVKIQILDGVAKVEGNVIGAIEDNFVEKWVYLTEGTKELKILPKHHKAVKVYFPDYGINGVLGKQTYILDLDESSDKSTEGGEMLQKCKLALDKEDWNSLEEYARDGFAPTYFPLAKHYFKLKMYDLADSYAQKSYQAKENVEKSKILMQILDKLGYYDESEVPSCIKGK